MNSSIDFKQERINNTTHTFIVGPWPKEIMIANDLLNDNLNDLIIKQINNNIIINVENGSAEYTLYQMDNTRKYSVYKLIESVLIND